MGRNNDYLGKRSISEQDRAALSLPEYFTAVEFKLSPLDDPDQSDMERDIEYRFTGGSTGPEMNVFTDWKRINIDGRDIFDKWCYEYEIKYDKWFDEEGYAPLDSRLANLLVKILAEKTITEFKLVDKASAVNDDCRLDDEDEAMWSGEYEDYSSK